MKLYRGVALFILATFVVVGAAYAALTRIASPEALARADSYRVWIALLKGEVAPNNTLERIVNREWLAQR